MSAETTLMFMAYNIEESHEFSSWLLLKVFGIPPLRLKAEKSEVKCLFFFLPLQEAFPLSNDNWAHFCLLAVFVNELCISQLVSLA